MNHDTFFQNNPVILFVKQPGAQVTLTHVRKHYNDQFAFIFRAIGNQ